MIWRVLLFAHLKEQFGPSIEVDAEPTAHAVLQALNERGLPVECCRLAADNEFLMPGDPLEPGQELALIPPVSGG